MHRIVLTLLLACMLALPMQTIGIYAESTNNTNNTKELLLAFTKQARKRPLSLSQKEHIENLDDNTRDILTRCIQVLLESARDTDGQPVNPEDINKDTIFVHSVINNKMGKQLRTIRGNELFRLFKVAHVIGIEPLTNAISYRIAQDITTLLRNYPSEMQDDVLSCFNSGKQPPKWFLIKAHLGPLDKEELMRIQKHLYLLQNQKTEQSIADYIGEHGQPPIFGGELNLSEKDFTSLSGIELIKNVGQVKELDLRKNFLLGPNTDPNFPRNGLKSFTSLRIVRLSHNQLSQLPSKFFSNNPALRQIHLDHNQLTSLPDQLPLGLSHLKELGLGDNQILRLPKNLFSPGMNHLEEFYLEHNPIREIPRDLFSYTPNLRWLYLDQHQIQSVRGSAFHHPQYLKFVNVDRPSSTNNIPIQSQPDPQLEGTGNLGDTHARPQAIEGRIFTSCKKISVSVVHGLKRLIPTLINPIRTFSPREEGCFPHKDKFLFETDDFSSDLSSSEDDDYEDFVE